MATEIRNLNADAPIEQDVLRTTTARAAEDGATERVTHDTGAFLNLTEDQATARLQQSLEFPSANDVTLLLQAESPTADGTTTGTGGTTPGAAGTTATGTSGATGIASGTTAGTTPGTTPTTSTDASATGTGTTTGTTGAVTATGTTGAAATAAAGAAVTTTDITLADLDTLGIDHVVADLTGIAASELEQDQGSIRMELGLDPSLTGQAAASALLTLLESFNEPIFANAANVGVTLTQAEADVFNAQSQSTQDDIVTRMAELGVDFVNVIGTAEPNDTGAAV